MRKVRSARVATNNGSVLSQVEVTGVVENAPTPEPASRPTRISLTQQKLLPTYTEEGYHYHVFNNEPGKYQMLERAGYTKVIVDGKPVTNIADRKTGLVATLFKIPIEWYEAEQAAKQLANDSKTKQTANEAFDSSGLRFGKVELT